MDCDVKMSREMLGTTKGRERRLEVTSNVLRWFGVNAVVWGMVEYEVISNVQIRGNVKIVWGVGLALNFRERVR